MCAGSAAKAGKRKTFQPHDVDQIDPSLKLVRSASASLAKLTGQPRAVARAALDALNEDADQACRLLLSGLALALLDNCQVEELKPGIYAYLAEDGEEEPERAKVLSQGAFAGCFLLRTEKHRKEPLRLFALEPVDVVCLVANANAETGEGDNGDDGQHGAGAAGPTAAPPEGWAELEYTEAPEVEGFGKDVMMHSCSFDPGLVQVPLEGNESLVLVRVVKKAAVVAPRNSLSSRRRQAPDQPSKRLCLAKRPRHTRYQRLELIGTGTFGKVFLAQRLADENGDAEAAEGTEGTATSRKVAVKQVPFENHKTREITLLENIHHSCIIGLLDSFLEKDENDTELLCMVLEYMPQNLHQKIGGHPLSVSDVRCFSFQLLRALAHLDGLHIVHRDLKPENILFEPESRAVKLADFGSAKVLTEEPSSSYICSRWWRAPELIFGATRYSTSIDWWSCGCIVAEMMLGKPLFAGESSWGQMYEIIRALGTPSLEQLRAMQAGSDGRLAGHFTKLAELQRPARTWEDLLPAFAEERQALDLPKALLRFDPSKRQHPARLLRNSFFGGLLEDTEPLPPNLFDFSEEELSSNGARRHLRALQRKALALVGEATNAVIELDPEPDPKRRRVQLQEPIVRLISEDLSDIP